MAALLEAKAEINQAMNDDATPLCKMAICLWRLRSWKPRRMSTKQRKTVAIGDRSTRAPSVVDALLEAKAEVNQATHDGDTAAGARAAVQWAN